MAGLKVGLDIELIVAGTFNGGPKFFGVAIGPHERMFKALSDAPFVFARFPVELFRGEIFWDGRGSFAGLFQTFVHLF